MTKNNNTIFLFDIDGTLTNPVQRISSEIEKFMKSLVGEVVLGVVGGSDIGKIIEQLGSNMDDILSTYHFVFAENGLTGYRGREPLPTMSINQKLGEKKTQELTNFCLNYMSTIELPVKRGNFVEFRKGMINVSPIGRSCNQSERDEFVRYESTVPVRKKFVEALQKNFGESGLNFSIGGQISIDIFPTGWDKTYCLRYLEHFNKIHFFGDKTFLGGNDYEIFSHPSIIGHTVTGPEDTCKIVRKVLDEL